SGVWGPVPMPANAQVNPAEAETLAKWVLTIK
ncbi:cytochrome C biogenesis protein CcsA, partial [Acinetobacter baumannii]